MARACWLAGKTRRMAATQGLLLGGSGCAVAGLAVMMVLSTRILAAASRTIRFIVVPFMVVQDSSAAAASPAVVGW